MKINIGKLARVLGRLAVAAPAVIAAAGPVIDAFKKPKAGAPAPVADTPAGAGRPTPDG